MKLLRLLLTATAAGLSATAFADNSPAGIWKIATYATGRSTSTGSAVIKLTLKDGKLTGTIADNDNGREDPISRGAYKNGTVYFTFYGDKNTTQLFSSGQINLGLRSLMRDDNDDSVISYSFKGKVIGDTLMGDMSWQRTVMEPIPGGRGQHPMTTTDSASMVATRVTPVGIWDVTMTTPAGKLTRQPMQFEYRNGQLAGTWLAPGKDANLRPVPIQNVVLDKDGFTFTIVDEGAGAKTTYLFDGTFGGNLTDVTPNRATLNATPNGLAAGGGSTVTLITGTMKMTGPDGITSKSPWKAIRWRSDADKNNTRTDVDVGRPYEVRPPPKP